MSQLCAQIKGLFSKNWWWKKYNYNTEIENIPFHFILQKFAKELMQK